MSSEYSNVDFLKKLISVTEALMKEINDFRFEISEIRKKNHMTPIVTSLSEEIEELQSGYREAMSSPTMKQAVNQILFDWRNRR